mmetsp:Transcript_77024/g.217969  ORF Transcript_77024/g.217969 Transcript_77024/m.217969 type:complete len:284 (+) Transcript_77024:3-854(+)
MPLVGRGLAVTRHWLQTCTASREQRPARTSLRSCTKAWSPRWRTGSRRMTVPLWRPQPLQAGASKQKDHLETSRLASMGGSCRKSPQRSICMPPKPCARSCRISRPTKSRSSKRSGSSMDTSSITSTRVFSQRVRVASTFRILLSMYRAGLCSSFNLSPIIPTPEKLWSVCPPMFTAASPVGAVTATAPGWLFSSSWMMNRSRKLFPVPAAPVMKRFSPRRARSAELRCSPVSVAAMIGPLSPGAALLSSPCRPRGRLAGGSPCPRSAANDVCGVAGRLRCCN